MRIRLFEQKNLPPTPVLPHNFKYNLAPAECSCYAYCDHCGAELYGIWVYHYYLDYRPQWRNALDAAADSQVRERIEATLKADILPIREYLSTITPSLQKYSFSSILGITFIFPEVFSSVQNDVRAFYKLEKCPICGMPLEHKKGYFALKGAKNVLNTILSDSEKRELDERTDLRKSCEYLHFFSFPERLFAEESYFDDDEKQALFAERLPGLDITDASEFRIYEEMLEKGYDFCIDDIFNLLRFRRASGLPMAKKAAKEFIDSCASLLPTDIVSTNADKIRKSPTLLQDYIHHLIKLDTEIYSASQYLPQLYKQRSIIDRKVTGEHRIRQYELNVQREELLKQIQDITKKINALSTQPVTIQVSDTDLPFKPIPPSAPTAPVYKTPGFFNKKATEQHNDALRRQFEMETQAYQAALAAYNAEMSRYAEVRQQIYDEKLEKAQLAAQAETDAAKLRLNELQINESNLLSRSAALEQQPIASMGLKDMIDKEIADFEAMIKRLFETRNALYNCNIVFGKYRNIVALSTFYEYLMAGRCESLEGAAGAYNLYESECRANQIIGQLDKVINSLEEIKDAQYMIYSQLQTANHQLDRMQTSLNKAVTHLENISENTDVIAHNTAINAYYAKVNAELTDSLGFMMALN